MTKGRITISIDERKIATVQSVATKKGLPISEIVERYLSKGLTEEIELTAAERYHYLRLTLNESLDNVLRLFGLEVKDAGLTDKFQLCLINSQGFLRLKSREYRYGIIELSIFELLNTVKVLDKNLFDLWVKDMACFGKMRKRYLALYPKSV